jgi:hypothetical protein
MKHLPVLALALAAGCGGAAGTHEDAVDESVAGIRELTTILEGVTDKASAEKAAPKLEALAQRLDKVAKNLEKLGKPGAAEWKRLEERMKGGLGGVEERMDAAMSRLADMGMDTMVLQAPVMQVMSKLMAIRAGLGG